MKQTCSFCKGNKYIDVTFFWFTLFKNKTCPTCDGKGFVNLSITNSLVESARSIVEKNRHQIESASDDSEEQCHLCEGREKVLRVTIDTHLSDWMILEVICEDMDLCLHCRKKLRDNIRRFRAAILNRMMLPAGSPLPNPPKKEKAS